MGRCGEIALGRRGAHLGEVVEIWGDMGRCGEIALWRRSAHPALQLEDEPLAAAHGREDADVQRAQAEEEALRHKVQLNLIN